MTHRKRMAAPKHYPIRRKQNTYIASGKGPHSESQGIHLVVLLRDVLGYASTSSEAKEILHARNVQINGRVETSRQRTVGFMDVITIEKIDKSFRVLLDSKGLVFKEIDDQERRLYQVRDKTTLKGGQTQLNLDSGENLLTDEEYSTQASLVVDLENREIESEIPLEEGILAYITGGRHVGELAEIQEIETVQGSQSNRVHLENEEGTFQTVVEYVYVVGTDEPEVTV